MREVVVKYTYKDGSIRTEKGDLYSIRHKGLKHKVASWRPVKVTIPFWVACTEYWQDTLSQFYAYGMHPEKFMIEFTYEAEDE